VKVRSRLVPWAALAVVLVAFLAIGARGSGRPPTDAERAHHLATLLRCPTCHSQSMANSDAPAAQAGRDEILRRVQAGQSDAEIKAFFVGRYGDAILLDPPRRGVSTLVWVLPVLAVVAALAGLAVAFSRWRPRRRHASADDEALVHEAMTDP
jgi:cytochrome c-type biogenesis protein CcmH